MAAAQQPTLLQRLEELRVAFSQPLDKQLRNGDLHRLAYDMHLLCDNPTVLRSCDQGQLASALQAVAKAAAATDAPLTKALAAEVAKEFNNKQRMLIETQLAVATAAFGCVLAATRLGWHGSECGRGLSGAASLLFGSGQGVLQLQIQLTAREAAPDGTYPPDACTAMAKTALLQLSLLRTAAQAAVPRGQSVPARLAAKLASPKELHGWLAELSRHIVATHRGLPQGCKDAMEVAVMFVSLVQTLCSENARLQALLSAARRGGARRGRAALTGAAPLVEALLHGVLPTLAGGLEAAAGSAEAGAAGSSRGTAAPMSDPLAAYMLLTEVLDADCLEAALLAHPLVASAPAGALAAAVRDAVRAARALPLMPAGMPEQACIVLHARAMELVDNSLVGLYSALREGTVSSEHRAALEAEAAEACWAVVELLPHAAATLEGLAAAFSPAQLFSLSMGLEALYNSIASLRFAGPAGTAQQAAAWAAASEAAARLLPLCVRLHAGWVQSNIPIAAELAGTATQLASGLRMVFFMGANKCLAWLKQHADAEAAASVPAEQMWRVHTTGCRAVHALLASPLPGELCAGAPWTSLTESVALWLCAARDASMAAEGEQSAPRCLGMFAATLEALEVAHGFCERRLGDTEPLSAAVVIAFGGAPPSTCQLASGMLAERWMARMRTGLCRQMAQEDLAVYAQLPPGRLAERVASTPQLAAALAASGTSGHLIVSVMQTSLQGLDYTPTGGNMAAVAAASVYHGISEMCECVPAAVAALSCQRDAGAGDADERRQLAGKLQEACRALRESRLLERWQSDPRALSNADIKAATDLSQPLGAALLRYWALPEHAGEAAAQLANAAATRSCAYLRCRHLGSGGGGPAAGQGEGSKRCSGCRSVWYCGEQCSHADWRAGHRRACKVLAAERQQRKQQRQQQAEQAQ